MRKSEFELKLRRNGASYRDDAPDKKYAPMYLQCNAENRILLPQKGNFTENIIRDWGHEKTVFSQVFH